jgi:hypothetical protein
VNHPVAIVFIDPWSCLLLAASSALFLVCVVALWRRASSALLMAELENQMADLMERANLHEDAAAALIRATRWRRLAWPRRRRRRQAL